MVTRLLLLLALAAFAAGQPGAIPGITSSADQNAIASTSSPAPAPSPVLAPAPGNSLCPDIQVGFDFKGGDLKPSDSSPATPLVTYNTTVVAASSPDECCAVCAANPDCAAWTLTPTTNCQNRLGSNFDGCCYLKNREGWQKVDAPDYASGVVRLPSPPAAPSPAPAPSPSPPPPAPVPSPPPPPRSPSPPPPSPPPPSPPSPSPEPVPAPAPAPVPAPAPAPETAPSPSPKPSRSCDPATFVLNTDFSGGDIRGVGVKNSNSRDTVVPAESAADCCAQCADFSGCGAWTMYDGTVNCGGRLGDAPEGTNCCYLKEASGWDPRFKAGVTSGSFGSPVDTLG